ncbi:MAG: DUF5671 domain-containing protein, partial [Chloroflexota bacterium]
IRRIYVYVVCFISLQLLIASINAMIGGFLQRILDRNDDFLGWLIFQIATIIVAAPFFIGHWVWAEVSARKQTDERDSPIRRLYLYVTMSAFLIYIIVAAVNGIQSLLSPAFAVSTFAKQLPTILNSIVTVIATGILWLYHRVITVQDEKATAESSHGGLGLIKYIYRLIFSATGTVLLMVGVFGVLYVLLSPPADRTLSDLPKWIALLIVGGFVVIPFQFFLLIDPDSKESSREALSWLYSVAFGAIGLLFTVSGMQLIQSWLFARWNGDTSSLLPSAVSSLVVGVLVLIYHEVLLYRVRNETLKLLRWLYGYVVSAVGMIGIVVGAITILRWGFDAVAGSRYRIPDVAAWLIIGVILWGYYRFIVMPISAKPMGVLQRLYVLSFSGLGLTLATLGLIGLQEWLFSRLLGNSVARLPDALAMLITGLPLWLGFWASAQIRFANGGDEEQKSDLRKAYLYVVIYIAVNTVVITTALLINGTLRVLLRLPTEGGLGLLLAIIIAASALWAYHAFVLRSDIKRAGESKLQSGMERLYWYVIAAVGLLALVVGLAGDVNVFVRSLQKGFDAAQREQLAGFTAMWLAGLPVWLMGWIPAQRRALRDDDLGADARRSILRKIYLYFYWLSSVLAVLFNAIAIVYQLLAFCLFLGTLVNFLDTITNLGQSIGFTVIGAVLWAYHFFVLRGDNTFTKLEQEAVEQKDLEAWQTLRVIIMSEGDSFATKIQDELKKLLPHLTPEIIRFPIADADTESKLAAAHAIVAPWTLAQQTHIANSPAHKIIVPTPLKGGTWIGLSQMMNREVQIAQAIRGVAQKKKLLESATKA